MARGSIYPYELANGQQRWMVMYRTSNGVQKMRRGFRGTREAQKFLNQVAAAVDRGEVVARRETFAEYIDRWLEEHRPRLEEGSYRDYRTHIERRLKPFFGHRRLSAITSADVRRYVSELANGARGGREAGVPLQVAYDAAARLEEFTVAELAADIDATSASMRTAVCKLIRRGSVVVAGERRTTGRGRRHRLHRFVGDPAGTCEPPRLSNKTINNSVLVLRLALGHAEEDGLIARNPAATRPGARERVMLPKAHREMDYLRLYEIPKYLDACSPVYRPLAELLIACGLRISEALALRFNDIDFETSSVRVLRSRKRTAEGSTKSDRFRSVDFGPRIDTILRDLRARRAEYGAFGPMSRVFVDEDGAPFDRSTISSGEHKDALAAAGLRRSLRLHDLRHTAAASWLACGLPLIYVQRQLGHASIQTTESAYGHLEESYLRGAAQRVESAIWEGQLQLPAAT